MIYIFRTQFSKINQFSSQRCELVRRNLCTSFCVQQKLSKFEEIAERKRRDEQDKAMRWTKLYHFTDMKYHAIMTRLKIYPLLATILGTPVACVIEKVQIIPEFTFVPVLACGFTGTLMLLAYSAALSNTIGLIHICKDNKNLRIAYIDFLGRQQFIETTVDEVIKWEKSPVKFGYYKTVKTIDDKTKTENVLKIPWNVADIYDNKLFRRCFGK